MVFHKRVYFEEWRALGRLNSILIGAVAGCIHVLLSKFGTLKMVMVMMLGMVSVTTTTMCLKLLAVAVVFMVVMAMLAVMTLMVMACSGPEDDGHPHDDDYDDGDDVPGEGGGGHDVEGYVSFAVPRFSRSGYRSKGPEPNRRRA